MILQIMVGSSFEFNADIEKEFVNPKLCSVPEALTSPEKRRVNMSGVLKGVSICIKAVD